MGRKEKKDLTEEEIIAERREKIDAEIRRRLLTDSSFVARGDVNSLLPPDDKKEK